MALLTLQTQIAVTAGRGTSVSRSLGGGMTAADVNFDNYRETSSVCNPYLLQTLVDSSRPTTQAIGTQIQVSRPRAAELNTWRFSWAGGTNPTFRSARGIGLAADSVVDLTLLSSCVARLTVSAGTALSTGAVQVGDVLLFERSTDTFASAFSSINQGKYLTVVSKTANSLDLRAQDSLAAETSVTLGVTFAEQIQVFSPGSVQIGDTALVRGLGFNKGNRGKLPVVFVSSTYVEVTAPCAVAETVTLGAQGDLVLAEIIYNLCQIMTPADLEVRFDTQAEGMYLTKATLEAGYMLGTVEFYKISAYSTIDLPQSVSVVVGTLQAAPVLC